MKPYIFTFVLFLASCIGVATIPQEQQKPCIRIELKTIEFKKPVSVNQVIGTINVCDEDLNQRYTWKIIDGNSGNSSGYWQIQTDPNNPMQGIISVSGNQGNVNKINKDGITTYVITVTVTDNVIPPKTSLPCKVIMNATIPPLQ